MVIKPEFFYIPESWDVQRDIRSPKESYSEYSFGKTFDETYDYDTLFSGVLKHDDTLVITAPPFLNFKEFVDKNIVINDGYSDIKLNFNDLDRSGVAISKINRNATHLYLTYKNDAPIKIEIETLETKRFKDKKILFTMIKNDPMDWILNWVQYHHEIYGIDGFVIFSNNSDQYSCQELEDYLKSDSYELCIVDWEMKWGVIGPPWDSDYCKIVGLEYLKYKFAYDANFVLNLDIDEYFVSEYSVDEIIEAMISNRKDSINMESKNTSRYSLLPNDGNINNYCWYHKEDIDSNKMVKWVTLPKYSRTYPWTTHYIFSPNRDDTDDFYYAHMAILSGEHHLKENSGTNVTNQRFLIREDGYEEDVLLKTNLKNMKNSILISKNG